MVPKVSGTDGMYLSSVNLSPRIWQQGGLGTLEFKLYQGKKAPDKRNIRSMP